MSASGTPPHQPHDKGYKYLFSSKRAFLEFLRAFIPRDWVHQIDEDHLYRPDTTYILPDFRDKEADIVYELRRSTQDGQPEIIFYILMELQSTVDFHMPYRLLLYQVEIWRDYMKNIETKEAARKDFRFPPIVPIVLYNGKAPWTAAQTFRQMLKGERLFGDELLNKLRSLEPPDFHGQVANFFRFMAATISIVCMETFSKPRKVVHRMPSLILDVYKDPFFFTFGKETTFRGASLTASNKQHFRIHKSMSSSFFKMRWKMVPNRWVPRNRQT